MQEPIIKKINVDGLVNALSNATDAMNNFGSLLGGLGPEMVKIKKKRGAGYTKRRISKRTGKSSSH